MGETRLTFMLSRNRVKEDPMQISDLMTTDVVTTTADTSLRDVARTLLEHEISGMPVCDDSGRSSAW